MVTRRAIGLAVLGLASAAVAGVLTARPPELTAAAEAPPRFARLLEEVPPPPGSYLYPLGTSLHVDGLPREVGWAISDSSPEGIVQRYQGIWTSRGLSVDRYEDGADLGVVALSPRDHLIRTVVASRRDDGKTVIIASLAEPLGTPEASAPIPPGCEELRSTGARDGEVLTEVTTLDCAMPIEELMTYFDNLGGVRDAQVLPERGRPDLHATWSFGEHSHATVLGTQTRDSPPRTAATVTWQEERAR